MGSSVGLGWAFGALPGVTRLARSGLTPVRQPALLEPSDRNLIHGTPDLSRSHPRCRGDVCLAGAGHAAATAAPGFSGSRTCGLRASRSQPGAGTSAHT